ncbi:hypothetical protein [Serratia proteamaculans]|uniref:hypothetical protein n=1 Tax=Serratia proteamaculans TaxID=28151 RepID=UPI00218439F5|nr:hypothetical protein [Serratia proteamaculans]CAI2487968.1 Uncharacterised protein [Serratia proteamaculans]
MTEEISFMNLPPVTELKRDGVLAVSQQDGDGKPDTFKASVEQLADMMPPGAPGKSAYEVWLSAGNTGTEADFIASLKGEPGEGADITVSPAKDNLLRKEGDGLKVLASHPIIPKVLTHSYSTSKSAMARQSMPDGAVVYRGTLSVKNPLGIKSLNNVGVFTSFSQQSGYFYLGKDNEFVTIQVYATPKTTTASTITVNLALVFSADPYRAFDVYSGEEAVSSEAGDARISVSIRLIAGTTMGQNGFD